MTTLISTPATETPVTAYEFIKICQEAGLPEGQVNLINGKGSLVGDLLARHPGVDQITFTGSVPTGRRVLEAAASHAIPTNMELGGKSPQILFADADMDRALPIIAGGAFTHCGQVCNAGTRLLVERSAHDGIIERLHDRIKGMRIGAGIDDPDMGPLVSTAHRADVERYYDVAAQDGELLMGADVPTDAALADGAFVRPALVVGASNQTRIAREEIFGPILTVIPLTILLSGLSPAFIPTASTRRLVWANICASARSGSTRSAWDWTSNFRSAATSSRALAARRVSRPSRPTSRPRISASTIPFRIKYAQFLASPCSAPLSRSAPANRRAADHVR
jgi:hypothetical protein